MNKNNILNLVVYIIVILSYLGTVFYQKSALINAVLVLSVIGLISIWLIKSKRRISYNKIIIIYISMILIVLTQKFNLISIPLIVLIIVLAGFNNNINIKVYLKISILCFVFVLIMYFIFGVNKSCDTSIWRSSSNTIEYRYALGFNHANQAMFKWLCIALGFLALSTQKNIFKISSIIGAITFIIYYFTVSRTSVVVIFLVVLSMIIFRKSLSKNISLKFKRMLALTPILFTGVSFLSILLSNFEYLNNLFSGRFVLYKYYLNIAGINLLGNNFIENNAMLDNSYLHMMLSKGLIFSLCYMILIYSMITKSKNITRGRAIIILGYFITGLVETILFKFDLIILIIILLFKEQNEGEKCSVE